MRKLMKPKMFDDVFVDRKIVITPTGNRFVLGNDRAFEVFNAGMRVYNKHKKRCKKK